MTGEKRGSVSTGSRTSHTDKTKSTGHTKSSRQAGSSIGRSTGKTGSTGKAGSTGSKKAETGKSSGNRKLQTSAAKASDSKKNKKNTAGAYVAYIDTEFNAFDYYGHNDGIQEVIEIGLVVMRDEEFIDGFSSYCALKKGHTLTKRTEQLTGISRKDIADAPQFADVVEHMNVFLDMYNPAAIYAYGPEDRMQLIKTAELYHINGQELYYINRISDIMKDLRNMLGTGGRTKLSLSVKDICEICGIEAKGIHDAYNDAMYLGKSAEMIINGHYDPSRLDKVLDNKNWLSGYRSARRFKEQRKTVMLRDEQLEPIRSALTRLRDENIYPDCQLRALWDDLRVITGREPEYE